MSLCNENRTQGLGKIQGGTSEILKSAILSKSKFVFSNSEEILMPKEGLIFGLFSNNVLYCGSKTGSYVGFEGLDFKFKSILHRKFETSVIKRWLIGLC